MVVSRVIILLFLIAVFLVSGSAAAQEHSHIFFIGPGLDADILGGGSGGSGGPSEADTYVTISLGYRWFIESLKYGVPWGIQGSVGIGVDGDLDSAATLSLRFPIGMRPSGSDRLFTFNMGPELQYYQSSTGTLVLGAGGFLELALNTGSGRRFGFFGSLAGSLTPSWGISETGRGFLLHAGLSLRIGLAVNSRWKE